jgi:sugar/nucleoside kinase (ribokinase family)
MIDKIVTTGEALANFRTSAAQPLWQTAQATIATGGAEANVATAVARAGVRSVWYGRVGDDEPPQSSRAEGIDTLS